MAESYGPKCAKCGYEFTGLAPIGKCPECGQPYNLKSLRGVENISDSMQRTEHRLRRFRTIFFVALAVMALVCGGALQVLTGSARPLALMTLLAVLLASMALASYLYEKD